ncbi:MAG TPA: phasin family protein [Denitromonas sp.]|uniref:phasin family protein n=1 Tax=Denitromonas sp. TaxID=2734609 RepID=UPI002BF3BBE5|nr:TIGR01841 family phasin [Zoogloeaceae bacterium]HQU90215.1 phasin family protein [Denitromonas sp.]HQV16342.1 phasin family protein [Denitromonas sp.]
MSSTLRTAAASSAAAGNPFLTLSKVYLRSLEDLSSLNLKIAREALDDCASATQALSAPMDSKAYTKCLSGLGQPMLNKAVAHSREICDVMANTHKEMTSVIKAQLAQPQMAWPGAGDWNAMQDMFTKGFEQLTASATKNFAAVTDASTKAIAATTTDTKKAP